MRTRGTALGLAAVIGSSMIADASPAGAHERASVLPDSKLAVLVSGQWRVWWTAHNSPARWVGALPVLTNGVTWHHSATRGIEWGALRVAGDGEAWRLRVILARIDPRDVHFALYKALRGDSLGGAWTVESAPGNAVLALDAGQFSYGRPWGLVVRQGREEQPPGRGPLSTAIMFDSDGVVSLIPAQLLKKLRGSSHPEAAFQSYPTLLTDDGDVPAEVRGSRGGIDLEHRDSRLALGELRDGRILIALTRFDGLDGALAVVPFGPTVPEMSAIMGALGCRSAVMLDGGISGQMMIRDSSGTKQTWRGWRMVPMGLVATVR